MRFGTIGGRAVLVHDGRSLDVGVASDGRLPADPIALLERWDDLQEWAARPAGEGWEPLDMTSLGPPVPCPRQVFALAVNYADHAAEAQQPAPENPYVFTKFPSCITGPFDPVVLPSNRTDWEAELVVVIGRKATNVSVEEAWQHVAGLTVGQDISERRVQFRKPIPHLSVAKSYPTFGPIGPWAVSPDELPDPDNLALSCRVNGEEVQSARTDQMVFSVPELVASISSMVRLLPGDLIFTGTPSGVGSTRNPRRYLASGDVIETEVEGVGTIRNRCIERS